VKTHHVVEHDRGTGGVCPQLRCIDVYGSRAALQQRQFCSGIALRGRAR